MAIICREHKLLFIMVPGTGCSTVGKALQNKLGGTFLPERSFSRNGHRVNRKHNTVSELIKHGLITEEEHEEYLVFASIRNPFDRWVTYYQRYEGDWLDYYKKFSRRQVDREKRSFNLSDEEVKQRLEQREARLQKLRRRQRIIRALGFNVWMAGTLLRWALGSDKGGRGDISRYAFPMLNGVDIAIRQERLSEGLNRVLEIAGVDRRVDLPKRNTTSGKKSHTEYYTWTTRRIGEFLLGDEMNTLGYEFEGPTDENSLVHLRDEERQTREERIFR